MIMGAHLTKYFERQRDHTADRWGGYAQMSPATVINLQCAQRGVMDSILSLMYHMAFDVFAFEEVIFRRQLEKELKQVKIFSQLSESSYPADKRQAERMRTPFVKVYLDL